MTSTDQPTRVDGPELHARVRELLPMPRSLTGPGTQQTLQWLQSHAPFEVHEIASATAVHDWVVPDEWTLRRATLIGPDGTVLIDSDEHPLGVVGYSEPVDRAIELDELQQHLHSLPELPHATPWRNSYYQRNWGFCLPDEQRRALPAGEYRVHIDADLGPGRMQWAELVLPGASTDTVLVSTHVCHPAMANDNASGIAVLSGLAEHLASRQDRHLTWRLIANPGTIGSLVWLHENPGVLDDIVAGFTLSGLGDDGPLTWKPTFGEDAWVDRAASEVLGRHGGRVRDYSPWGYDERQYNAPGFRLPVGHVGRTLHGSYPEYHTSLDDLDFVSADRLGESLDAIIDLVDVLEQDRTITSRAPYGEPRLGPRGLYPQSGGRDAEQEVLTLLWVLHLADGAHSLLDVARRAELPFPLVVAGADRLVDAGLLDSTSIAR